MSAFDRKMTAIVQALDTFETLLTEDRPADLAGFVRGRIALSRSVATFLADEWSNLSQNLAGGPDGSQPDRTALHHAFVSLRVDYSRHIAHWDSASLVKDWKSYRRDCQHLITAMRALVRARARGAALKAA